MAKGLHHKYLVNKVEGLVDPNAHYFVLRMDTDPVARAAALHYAYLIQASNPQLAKDLTELVNQLEYAAEHNLPGPMTVTGLDEED